MSPIRQELAASAARRSADRPASSQARREAILHYDLRIASGRWLEVAEQRAAGALARRRCVARAYTATRSSRTPPGSRRGCVR